MTVQSLKILSWLFGTQAGKATALTTGTGSVLTLVFALHTSAMNRIDVHKIDLKEYVIEKIEIRDEILNLHVKNFSDKQDETNKRLDRVIEHIMNE